MLRWFKKKTSIVTPKEGYDLWATTYSTESNPIKDFSNKLVEELLPDLSGKSILDAGCGTGHFCQYAEKNKATRIIGIDSSPGMVDQANKNCLNARIYQGDLSSISFNEEPVDVIICALVIGHIENISSVFKNLSMLLKTGGKLILTDFHPVQTMKKAKRTFKDPQTGETLEIKHYLHPLSEIKNLLAKSNFTIERIEEPQWNNMPVVYGIEAVKN